MKKKILLFSFLFLCVASAAAARVERPFEIVAHRGVKKFAPENTLPAIQKAIDMGLDYVELDIRETKDGVLVIMHNSTVDATTNGTGAVAEMTLEEIKALDAGVKFSKKYEGVRAPTFSEALAFMKGKIKGYIDFKAGSPEKLVALIEEHGMADQVAIYDGIDSLMTIRKLNPEIPIMPGADNVEQLKLLKKTLDITCVETSINKVDRKFVEEAHRLGIKVFADLLGPFDNRTGLITAAKLRIDVIQTDNPDILLEVIEKHGK